jgi:flavin-dependent dehydrogenase
MAMAEKAKSNDVEIMQDKVTDIQFLNDEFIVHTQNNSTYKSRLVIGAYGKRSEVDIRLSRRFIKKKSPYLAVKTHVKGNFPDDMVGLHNFKGGYCGASKVENDAINLCYITDYKSFKKYKSIDDFQEKVVFKNKKLKSIFTQSKSLFKSPLAISQISFSNKKPVEKHILMCGDTAGLIHPLCGNGMSMAIRSGQIASQLILNYLSTEIESREILEKEYQKAWKKTFDKRLRIGRLLASLLNKDHLTKVMMVILELFPGILPIIIGYTHGKPMQTQ